MSNGLEELQDAFKQLRLSEVSLELPVLMREAEQQSWTYYELLNHLLQYELTKRDEKNKARRLKWAKFPYQKTLDDYDLSEQNSLTERQMRQLKEMNWLEQQYNLILLGPPGVGKTLNTALGIVHQCGTFVHCMRAKSPPSAKIIVQLYNLLYTYFMYEFSYK